MKSGWLGLVVLNLFLVSPCITNDSKILINMSNITADIQYDHTWADPTDGGTSSTITYTESSHKFPFSDEDYEITSEIGMTSTSLEEIGDDDFMKPSQNRSNLKLKHISVKFRVELKQDIYRAWESSVYNLNEVCTMDTRLYFGGRTFDSLRPNSLLCDQRLHIQCNDEQNRENRDATLCACLDTKSERLQSTIIHNLHQNACDKEQCVMNDMNVSTFRETNIPCSQLNCSQNITQNIHDSDSILNTNIKMSCRGVYFDVQSSLDGTETVTHKKVHIEDRYRDMSLYMYIIVFIIGVIMVLVFITSITT